MARSEARIAVAIWDDEDFLDLTPDAQRMFMFLLSQRDLAHTGVLALRERRWSRKGHGLTVTHVVEALAELRDARFIVVDEEAEEVLIRSFIRHDKVYRQPNVLRAAADQLEAVSSPLVRAALAEELRRVAKAEDLKGDAIGIVADMLAAIGTPTPNPPPKGSGNPSERPDPEAAESYSPPSTPDDESGAGHTEAQIARIGLVPGGEGSGNPSANPSRSTPGDRGDVTTLRRSPHDPDPRAPTTSAALVLELPLVGELVEIAQEQPNAGAVTKAWIDFCRANNVQLTDRHIKRYAAAIKRALGEGFDIDLVKRALAEMLRDRVVSKPLLLDNYLLRVQQGPELSPRRATPGEASAIRMAPPGTDLAADIHDTLTRPA